MPFAAFKFFLDEKSILHKKVSGFFAVEIKFCLSGLFIWTLALILAFLMLFMLFNSN